LIASNRGIAREDLPGLIETGMIRLVVFRLGGRLIRCAKLHIRRYRTTIGNASIMGKTDSGYSAYGLTFQNWKDQLAQWVSRRLAAYH
jgi:hypothetical protein